MPNNYVPISKLNIPLNLVLADHEFLKPEKICLFLGAARFWALLCNGQIEIGTIRNHIYLHQTKLSCVIAGQLPVAANSNTHCHLSINSEIQNQF